MKHFIFTLAALTVVPSMTLAQDAVPDTTTDTETAATPETQDTPDPVTELEADMEAFKKEVSDALAAEKAAREAQQAKSEEEVDALEEQVQMLQEEQEAMMMAEAEKESGRKLKIYGFFDVTFAKNFYEEDAPYNQLVSPYSSFILGGFNLYVASQMTETLSALAELKFTFLPMGQPGTRFGDQEVVLHYQDGTPTAHFGENHTIDTTVMDPFTTGASKLGGVAIERVHMDWAPRDWFKLTVGRYLTPYGIWNVDHGSPVIMAARLPYMMIREMVPASQTGIQISGRAFPHELLYFDYGVTLSNGRGDLDSMQDMNENKALGARLALTMETRKVRLTVGGYGYMGAVSDKYKVSHMVLDNTHQRTELDYDGVSAPGMDNALEIRYIVEEAYKEYIATADIKLEMFGILAQSEFVWRKVNHTTRGNLSHNEAMFSGVPQEQTDPNYHHADYTGLSVYGLLGYTLPLAKTPVKITPYVMYEYNASNDTQPYLNMKYYIAGLNVKPSPFVTLKLEGNIIDPENEFYGDNMKSLMLQTAVSF